MTKSTCTPARKALAMRFKHGDLHHGKRKRPAADKHGYY